MTHGSSKGTSLSKLYWPVVIISFRWHNGYKHIPSCLVCWADQFILLILLCMLISGASYCIMWFWHFLSLFSQYVKMTNEWFLNFMQIEGCRAELVAVSITVPVLSWPLKNIECCIIHQHKPPGNCERAFFQYILSEIATFQRFRLSAFFIVWRDLTCLSWKNICGAVVLFG